MKRETIMSGAIGYLFGSVIGGCIVNAILYTNFLLFKLACILILLFIGYLLWLNYKQS